MSNQQLAIEIGGIKMKNPVMTASGTFGYGEEFADFVELHKLGAVVLKGITLEPSAGNPPPRIVETAAGMLNAIGLQNVGVEKLISEKLPYLRQFDFSVIVNINGKRIEEYVEIARRLDSEDVDGLEINVSCPNVEVGGMAFGVDAKLTAQVVESIRKVTELPLIVKLSPNVTDITEIAKSAENAGADVLSCINTLLGIAVDAKTRKPMLANVTGGLSGPAIKPVALRIVWQVYNAVNIPIIGMGGIMTAEDAVEFIIAGASAVAVGTANFVDPRITMKIIEGIKQYFLENSIEKTEDLVGSLVLE